MFPILDKLFTKKKRNRDKLFGTLKDISILSDDIERKKKAICEKEYNLLLDKKDEVFISLSDFLYLMEVADLSMSDILSKCKHISELDKDSSVVEMYSIVEDNHVVLCSDTKNCPRHKNYAGTKIRIATIKKL